MLSITIKDGAQIIYETEDVVIMDLMRAFAMYFRDENLEKR